MTGRFEQALTEMRKSKKGRKGKMPKKFSVKSGDKSAAGGLTAKGVKRYRAANPGSKLKTAVTTKPSKLKKGSKSAKRRKSFCARMGGMKKRLTSAKTRRDPDSRINKALRKWNCSTDANPNALQQIAEMIIEGVTSGENPLLTGDRVGDFMGRLKMGKVKRGRRGGGSAVSKDKRKVATHRGREKTDQDYFDQIKRIKKKTANTATKYGHNRDMIKTGMELQNLVNSKKKDTGRDTSDSDIEATIKGVHDDQTPRRAAKDAARSLFTSHMKSAYKRRTQPKKDYT